MPTNKTYKQHDPEWAGLLQAEMDGAGGDEAPPDLADGGRGAWWEQRLHQRWLHAGEGRGCDGHCDCDDSARCVALRWEAMLCDAAD